jgi:Uma2 family endonuclease
MTELALDHAGPWTEADYHALPETRQRIELLDGSLLVTPAPSSDHQQLARRLANLLEAGAPAELDVVEAVNVRVAPSKLLIPDLLITRRRGATAVYQPEDVLLVAEVVSPSTATTDRMIKPQLYAAAGIPWFLRVELEVPRPPGLWLYRLAGTSYAEHAHANADETFTLTEPVRMVVDPAVLLRRHA